jgi:hypothetical protein
LSSFFCLFSLFPIPFPFFCGFGGVWIGYPYCRGAVGCCKAILLFFQMGVVDSKGKFLFLFFWGLFGGLLIQKKKACVKF